MPTFTTIALENLLEPTVRVSLKKLVNPVENEPIEPNLGPNPSPDPSPNPRHLYISPALYATPAQAPTAEYSSPCPISPSPYVVNIKRRRGGSEIGNGVTDFPLEEDGCGFRMEEEEEEVVEDNFVNLGEFVGCGGGEESEAEEVEERQIDSRSFVSAQGEFFDANDDFSSDGSMSNGPSFGSRIGAELHATRLSLLEEVEKRKIAEDNLILMRCQWERISKLMSQAGFTFPGPPAASDGVQLDKNCVDHLSQEVVVTRFVSEAIGRGKARAEAEEAAATIIEAKDQEISRLRDRLQYFETVNHEMSQRKLVDVARRQQERKRRRQSWMWSFMGLSIAMGVSLVAYSCIPQTSNFSLLKSGDSIDTSSIDSSETS